MDEHEPSAAEPTDLREARRRRRDDAIASIVEEDERLPDRLAES